MKRKNLQCFSNLEPCPKRIKNYNTILKNTLKRKISYSDMSNINTFSLSQSIYEINHNDILNNFKDKQEQSDLDYLKQYYFLYN